MTSDDVTARAGRLAIWAALAACLSTALGGSSFVAMRFLVTETDPVTIAFLRNAGAALVLTPIAFAMVRSWPGPRELLIIGFVGAVFFDDRRHSQPGRILAGHDRRPRRRTGTGRGVGIGETNSSRRQRIDMRRLIQRTAGAAQVSPAEIVHEKQNHV